MKIFKEAKIFFGSMIVLSWLTVPFLGAKYIEKYKYAVGFISVFIFIESFVAKKFKWWSFPRPPLRYLTGEMALVLGPFIPGSLWIMKLTYGRFGLYMLLNLIADWLFIYPFQAMTKKLKMFRFGTVEKPQLLGIFLFKAVLMYGFQYFIVEKSNKEGPS
ncbi:hypothetical protein [Priestia flexa]|uniref:hypothetical protein n=1 Tax=Priestia flexa TaxID=86664 RepID=UPI001B32746F|nr:hypothetical protein [Priestia flexa]